MIPVQVEQNIIETNVINEPSLCRVNEDRLSVIFGFLENKIYSDKIMAVIREYLTNAYDANVENGKSHIPVHVNLPTEYNPSFSVRDSGKGLNKDEVEKVFFMLCESTKLNSNEFNGMLGIGSKSGFAYSQNFVVKSYQNGVVSTYNCYKENGQSKIVLFSTYESTEPSGLEIIIPVKESDIQQFLKRFAIFYNFLPVKPTVNILSELTNELIDLPDVLLSGDGYRMYKGKINNNEYYALMGNVAYPIDIHKLGLYDLSYNNLVIDFPIGSLNFSISRESLEYDENTVITLKKYIDEVFDKITNKIENEVLNASTYLKACEIYSKYKSYYSIRNLSKEIQHSGKLVSDYLIFENFNLNALRYSFDRRGRITHEKYDRLYLSSTKELFILDDIQESESPSVRNKRIKTILLNQKNGKKNFYLLKFIDNTLATKDDNLSLLFKDGDLQLLSSFEKYKTPKKVIEKNNCHTKINGVYYYNDYYNRWVTYNGELDLDGDFYYVILDNNRKIKNDAELISSFLKIPSNMAYFFGKKKLRIYGVKKDTKQHKLLVQHGGKDLKVELGVVLTKKIERKREFYVNLIYNHYNIFKEISDWELKQILKYYYNEREHIELKELHEYVQMYLKFEKEKNGNYTFFRFINLIDFSKYLKEKTNLINSYENVINKYPLLFSNKTEHLIDYIKLKNKKEN